MVVTQAPNSTALREIPVLARAYAHRPWCSRAFGALLAQPNNPCLTHRGAPQRLTRTRTATREVPSSRTSNALVATSSLLRLP